MNVHFYVIEIRLHHTVHQHCVELVILWARCTPTRYPIPEIYISYLALLVSFRPTLHYPSAWCILSGFLAILALGSLTAKNKLLIVKHFSVAEKTPPPVNSQLKIIRTEPTRPSCWVKAALLYFVWKVFKIESIQETWNQPPEHQLQATTKVCWETENTSLQ